MTTKALHKHDESWYYHLSKIKWDFFLSIRYKRARHYGTSFQSHSQRRDAIWNLFQNTRKELQLPRNAIQWFVSTEHNQIEGYHNHILVKSRADVPFGKQDILQTLFKNLPKDLVEDTKIKEGDILPKSFQVVENSQRVVSYVLKTPEGEERVTGIKEKEFFSEKFIRLCQKMKIKGRTAW
jgi:hypothetical protein